MAIGQGSVTVTPIQLVRMIAAVATGGELVQPHLLKNFSAKSDRFPLAEDTVEQVTQGMYGVINEGDLATFRRYTENVDPAATLVIVTGPGGNLFFFGTPDPAEQRDRQRRRRLGRDKDPQVQRGPQRRVDESFWPDSPRNAAQDARLREAIRELVSQGMDATLAELPLTE